MRHVISFLLSLAFMLGGGAIAGAQEPMLLPTHPEPLLAETAAGEHSFTVEIADTAEKRGRGLMFRRSMGDDHGMLFVFEESRNRSFWMKDTPMPLDLLFVGEDGRVRAIERGEPFSTDGIAPDTRAQFVLELKAGTAQRTGIEVGDRLRHPLIDAVAQND